MNLDNNSRENIQRSMKREKKPKLDAEKSKSIIFYRWRGK